MQPQGTALVNTEYFDKLTAEINAIDVCADLQAVVNSAMASLQAEVTAIEAQIAALLPLITLPSANLGSIVAWITAFATPMLKPYQNYITQQAQQLAAIARVVTAIEAAAARLTSCTITIPPIT